MVVTSNILAMNANRMLGITTKDLKKRSEKLSSGYKINRSADDAAGLSISEKMRKQIRGLSQGSKNIEDGISLVQVADGALSEVHEILQRMNELSVQAANGTNSVSDREYIQQEIDGLKDEINRIGFTTTFNEIKIFAGEYPDLLNNQYIHNNGNSGGTVSDISLIQTTGKLGNLNWSFSYKVDTSKYANQIALFTYGFKDSMHTKDRHLKTDHLLQTIIDKGMNVNAGEKIIVSTEYKGDLFGKNQHNIYALNDTTNQKVIIGDSVILADVGDQGASFNFDYDDGGSNSLDTHLFNFDICSLHGTTLSKTALSNIFGNKDTFNLTFSFGNSQGSTGGGSTSLGEIGSSQNRYVLAEKYNNGIWIQMGAEAGEGMVIKIGSLSTNVLEINQLSVSTEEAATNAIEQLKVAIEKLSRQRATIGAYQNRLEHGVKINDNTVENTQNAESKIRDTNIANEMISYSKDTILQQAGISMLAQANQVNQFVLRLLS